MNTLALLKQNTFIFIYLDELRCELSKVEVRVSVFHVKICQSTNISKAGLILEGIDFHIIAKRWIF